MFDAAAVSDPVLVERAAQLDARFAKARPHDVIEALIEQKLPGGIAAVSSFGTESAVLLHIVSEVDPSTPILFLDTGMLFEETLTYRDQLMERLGLTDLRIFTPNEEELAKIDPDRMLWASDTDACCGVRKVEPLDRALQGFGGWLNGRKRYHGESRSSIPVVEADGPRIKANPLALMGAQEIQGYFVKHHLPLHPLQVHGFASIGCMPCTSRTAPGEGVRAGRWRGSNKTECGIHIKH